MADFRPLSKRGVYDPDLDELHDGVPPWLQNPLGRWLHGFVFTSGGSNADLLESFEMAARLRHPFSRTTTEAMAHDAIRRLTDGDEFGLDLTDFILRRGIQFDDVEVLNDTLRAAGSRWTASETNPMDDEGFIECILTRRDLTAAKAAIEEIRTSQDRAGQFLTDAWLAVATRDPRPSEGFDKVIKAIENAAQPVILPANSLATLGQINAAIRDKPTKWVFALEDLDVVLLMLERLWKSHFRHGTQSREDHTLEEADAAVHMAIPLVRYFTGGLIKTA